jgi:hypothetical protein
MLKYYLAWILDANGVFAKCVALAGRLCVLIGAEQPAGIIYRFKPKGEPIKSDYLKREVFSHLQKSNYLCEQK